MRQITTTKDECLLLRALYKTPIHYFGLDSLVRMRAKVESKIGRPIEIRPDVVLAMANAPETPPPRRAKATKEVDVEKLMFELKRRIN